MRILEELALVAALALPSVDPQFIGPLPANPTSRPSGGSIGSPGEYAGVAGIVEGDDPPADEWEPETVEDWYWWFWVWSWIYGE